MSIAEYLSGKLPDASEDDLLEMALNFGGERGWGEPSNTSQGTCDFGRFASAVFRDLEGVSYRIWWLSGGTNFIMATHVAMTEPDPVEVEEADRIAKMLALG